MPLLRSLVGFSGACYRHGAPNGALGRSRNSKRKTEKGTTEARRARRKKGTKRAKGDDGTKRRLLGQTCMDHVFTFVAHYLEGLSMTQVQAPRIREAIAKWLQIPTFYDSFGLSVEELTILRRDLSEAVPVPTTPFSGWWFVWSELGQDFTGPPKKPGHRSAFRIEIIDTRVDPCESQAD